jgi:hypothetical protein
MVEPLFDEASVSNSTFVEATNVPITDEAAVVRDSSSAILDPIKNSKGLECRTRQEIK